MDKVSGEAQQLRTLVFNGSIPLCVSVLPHELQQTVVDASLAQAFCTVPRGHYLSLALDQVMAQAFGPLLDEDEWPRRADCWFEYRGTPLKWHWPVGLLYDALVLGRVPDKPRSSLKEMLTDPDDLTQSAFMQQKESMLPWHITLRLKHPPDALYIDNTLAKCRESFMNYFKDADFVRWGGSKRLTNLRKEQQDSLWDGLVEQDYDKYWQVANKLIPLPAPSEATPSRRSTPSLDSKQGDMPRSIPIRIYLPGVASPLRDMVELHSPGGTACTLRDALYKIVPLFFPQDEVALARPIIHGILVPLDTDLSWLGSCLIGLDGWIHCVLALGSY